MSSDWYPYIYKACIYAGMIAFIIGFFTDSQRSLGAYISGYSVFILGTMMILVILFKNVLKVTQNETTMNILQAIMMTSGPFILILGVISFVLYLLINYKDNITAGHTAPGYSSFSKIIVMLLFIQFYLVNSNISSEKFNTTGKLSKVTASIICLLSVLTAICAIILYTILKYFSTDGFTGMA
jgi:hypothetical protein